MNKRKNLSHVKSYIFYSVYEYIDIIMTRQDIYCKSLGTLKHVQCCIFL